MSRPKVLYIGGTGRTGSTTVDQILGSIRGWLSGGELSYFWRRGVARRAICSCGQPILECEVWSRALATFDGDLDELARQMIESRHRFWSMHMPLMIIPGFTRAKMRSMRHYLATIQQLYHSIAEANDVDVIVDSSKEPHYSYLLREGTDLDVSFLLLVRDPRATGFSWRRAKVEHGLDSDEYMATRNSFESSLYFTVSNIWSEILWRRHRREFRFLRYEDFVADPSGCLQRIGRFVDPSTDLPFVDGQHEFEIGEVHTSWGNPDRVGRSEIEVRADERWKDELPPLAKFALTLLNLPLILRYGYPILPSGRLRSPRVRSIRSVDLGRG